MKALAVGAGAAASGLAAAVLVPMFVVSALLGGWGSTSASTAEAQAGATAVLAGAGGPGGASPAAQHIPPDYLADFQASGARFGIPWGLLAGIYQLECNFGRSQLSGCNPRGTENGAGAQGPGQFLAPTWRAGLAPHKSDAGVRAHTYGRMICLAVYGGACYFRHMSESGGADSYIDSANPQDLHAAGQTFQALSNACGDIVNTPDLQGGGKTELDAISIPDGENYEGTNGAVPGYLQDDIETLVQGVLGVFVSAQQQFVDAAMDLFQCAGDFRNADAIEVDQMPQDAGSNQPPTTALTYFGTANGMSIYKDDCNTGTSDDPAFYFRDRDGTWVSTELPSTDEPDDGNGAQVQGQTYQPPTAGRP